MIKKIMIISLAVMLGVVLQAQTRVIPMPDLNKPETVSVDQTQMYVTEGVSIYIYSLKDFKLIKKIGKRGEGPQEFNVPPTLPLAINIQTNDLFAESLGKVSWFSKDGNFKKEQKLPNPLIVFLKPFGKNFIGIRIEQENQKNMMKLNLYSDQFSKLKELRKLDYYFQPGKGYNVLQNPPISVIYENKLFVDWENDIIIDVLDLEVNKLYTIKHDIERRPVTADDKKEIIEIFRTNPASKDAFEILKPFNFPSKFPAIQNLFITGNKIYLVTFKKQGKQNELLIMDLKGKLLKQVFIDLLTETPIQPYPYTIENGILYQTVENLDEEDWELHVTEIK